MSHRVIFTLIAVALGACSGSPAPSGPSTPPPPPTNPIVVRRYLGMFHPVAHPGMGLAELTVSSDSTRVLQFHMDFATTGGPILEVRLVAAPDADDNQTVLDSPSVSLGLLKAVSGGQSYTVPGDVDLSRYRAVTVWCIDARVNFTTAALALQ